MKTEDSTRPLSVGTGGRLRVGIGGRFHRNTQDNGGADLSGAISSLRLPGGGKTEWDYTEYPFFYENTTMPNSANFSFGVLERRLYTSTNAADLIGTWTYDVVYGPEVTSSNFRPCHHKTVMTDPLGQVTEYFHSGVRGANQWSYGLPFTMCNPDSTSADPPETPSTTGPFVSQRIRTSGAGSAVDRTVKVEYASTRGTISLANERNQRVIRQQVIFHDDGDRFTDVIYSDFDGLGRFRNEERGGNFGSTKTLDTSFLPAVTYEVDAMGDETANSNFTMPATTAPWNFGQWTERTVSENGTTYKVEACFDTTTGFMNRMRTLASSARGNNDLLQVNVNGADGFPTRSQLWGGDGPGTFDNVYNSLCALTPPTRAPDYDSRSTYTFAALATSNAVEPDTSNVIVKLVDRTIDPSTGLVSEDRDTAGVETALDYDVMGRLVREEPQDDADAIHFYDYPTVALPNRSLIYQVEHCDPSFGGDDCPNDFRRLSGRYWTYDGLGRLDRHTRAHASGNDSRTTTWNDLDWKEEESTWGGVKDTKYLNYDRYGRAGDVTHPNSSGGVFVTRFRYLGERRVNRGAPVATTGGDTEVWVTEERDHHGRLISVCDAQSSQPTATGCNGQLTTYSYDPADRLVGVCQDKSGSSCGQSRSFDYDGRGFLLSESHPETGPNGNGEIVYTYDARGNALSRTVTNGSDVLNLRYSYDFAGRLFQVEEQNGSAWRRLKEFRYARSNNGSDKRAGKLVTAKRWNWTQIVAPLNMINGGDL